MANPLNRTLAALILGKGTKASVTKATTYAENQGEIVMATDENRIYIGNASFLFQDLLRFVLPWIICNNGEVVTMNGEVIWI